MAAPTASGPTQVDSAGQERRRTQRVTAGLQGPQHPHHPMQVLSIQGPGRGSHTALAKGEKSPLRPSQPSTHRPTAFDFRPRSGGEGGPTLAPPFGREPQVWPPTQFLSASFL